MITDKAIYRIEEKQGEHFTEARRFLTTCGSPMFQLPHLADFYAYSVLQQQPPNLAAFLRYGDAHPHTLPTEELTATSHELSDVDYRYYLTFAEESYGLRLNVRYRAHRAHNPAPLPGTITQANLFSQAAHMCDLVTEKAQQFADRNDGVPLPGADPAMWAERAARHRQYQQKLTAGASASLAAQHLYADFDAPYPGISVAGATVYAYVDRGGLTVSVHLDETEPWLLRGDGTVPMNITVQGRTLYTG